MSTAKDQLAENQSVEIQPSEALNDPVVEQALNPTRLKQPAFVLNAPFSFATGVANNIWMEELSDKERQPDFCRAMRQFMSLYQFLASESLTFLLPAQGNCGLQDLVFTANLGVVLQHLPDRNTVVVSNYTSEPRIGETEVGVKFFESMGYNAFVSPFKFEGEADLKHLHSNVYLGGYGIRSDKKTYEWMEQNFDMKVIPLLMDEPYLYHLDCSIFPVTQEDTAVCTEMYETKTIKAIEKETNIIDISADDCYSGLCNSVRLNNVLLNGSNLQDLKKGTEDYQLELNKNRSLEDIAMKLGFEVAYFDLSEFMKGGALLSCMVMHLNRSSYEFSLI